MNNNSVICKYISEHPNTWEQDFADLNIKVKQENNLAIFNYGIDCDFSNPIVQEARGIIIDTNVLTVTCFPFRKFGNHGESYADTIDWSTARVQEKVDGSIMKVWFYDDKWHVSTNGTIDAYSNIGSFCSSGKSYGQLFDEGAEDAGLDYSKLDPAYTYIFELVSPEAPIVIHYPKTTIYHTGTRHNDTGLEVNADIGVKKPKEYHLNSLDECIEAAKMINNDTTLDSIHDEGYVVVDKDWHRIKIKSPDYLKSHYFLMYNNPTDARVISIIRSGEVSEVCAYFPAFMEYVNEINGKINKLASDIRLYIRQCLTDATIMNRKTFFLSHKDHIYGGYATSYFYNSHQESDNLSEYVSNLIDKMSIPKLIELYTALH